MRKYIGYFICIGMLAFAAMAHSETVTLEPSKDTTLFFSNGGRLANGAGDFLFVGRSNNGLLHRALMAFDVAGNIPAGSRIDSVQLTLTMSRTVVGATTVNLHRLLADWGEGPSNAFGNEGGGATAEAGDATWLHTFSPTGFWQTPGGDFDQTPEVGTDVIGEDSYTWGTTAEMARTVQNWLDEPTASFGWILIGAETTSTAKRFNSRENSAGTTRPLLSVGYTPLVSVGGPPGFQVEMVSPRNNVQLQINITNTAGITPSQITGEWFALSATIGGAETGLLLLTDQGLVPAAAVSDIASATFSFDHSVGDSLQLVTLALGDIGFAPGDVLIYLYAFTISDFSALVVENIITVNVQ